MADIPAPYHYGPDAIAIVGIACRFPGAEDVGSYWQLLLSGKSMVRTPPAERLDLQGHPRSNPKTQFWGNFLDDVDTFDHQFFRKSSRNLPRGTHRNVFFSRSPTWVPVVNSGSVNAEKPFGVYSIYHARFAAQLLGEGGTK